MPAHSELVSLARTPVHGGAAELSELEIEAIDLFIGLIRLLGMPKSVGELYRLLFVSPVALPMETLMERLNMSMGSARHGVRLIRSFGAAIRAFATADRRIHYVAEW